MNQVLLTPDQWIVAKKRIEALGFPPHQDNPKNWDHYLALESILTNIDQGELIIDVGGYQGVFTAWLKACGYQRPMVLGKQTPEGAKDAGIEFMKGDITKTTLPTGEVGCIACMSVIEHGVLLDEFFQECYRILRPGGRLIISTDYWPKKIDTKGLRDDWYDCEVKIFSSEEILNLINIARNHGFRISSVPVYQAQDQVVTWERMNLKYTFIVLEFIRDAR